MLNGYLFLNIEVIIKADTLRYGKANGIRSINLAPVSLFSMYKLRTFSGKHLEDISHAHIDSLMYKLITSAKDSEYVYFIGFNKARGRRRDDIAFNKNKKGQYFLRITLKYAFGIAEHQEKATNGLAYKLTLLRSKDDAVQDKTVGIGNPRIKIDHIHRYVTQYTPSIQQQSILSKQI